MPYELRNKFSAHRYMNIFEGHTVEDIAILPSNDKSQPQNNNACMCLEHRHQPLMLFCQYCQQAICRDCMPDHQGCQVEKIDNVADKQINMMEVVEDL